MKSVVIANNKGGVGKTVIEFNIMVVLATKYNKKVLVIDNDAQHNMSNILFEGASEQKSGQTEQIYESNAEASTLIHKTKHDNLDIIPSGIRLTATELKINSMAGRELIIKNWLFDNRKYLEQYDYIFFDCNPSMNQVNINAYHAADSIVLITDVDIDGLYGVEMFMELYYPIRSRLDRAADDNVKGLIVNKFEEVTKMSKEFHEHVKHPEFAHSDLLFNTMIHDAITIAETKVSGEVVDQKRNPRAYNEIVSLIEEMMERGIL